MTSKAFQLSIEVDIHAITCPGVWLCPNNGDLSLSVFMLNSYGETSYYYPVFPLLIHEKFIFNTIIRTANSLGDLQNALNNEYFYCELIQWPLHCRNMGNVLAIFETPLVDLLYPTIHNKNKVAGVDVELLMETCKSFPGIIAPKIEVSTKTSIKEVCTRKLSKNNCISYVTNPKTIRSCKACYKRSPVITQKSVCHTDFSKRNRKQRNLKCERSDRKCNCNSPLILQHENFFPPCKHVLKKDNHIKCRNRLRSGASENVENPESFIRNKFDRNKRANDYVELNQENFYHKKHISSDSCPICIKYQRYFNKSTVLKENGCKSDDELYSTSVDEYRTDSGLESTSSNEITINKNLIKSAHRVHDKVNSVLGNYQNISKNSTKKYHKMNESVRKSPDCDNNYRLISEKGKTNNNLKQRPNKNRAQTEKCKENKSKLRNNIPCPPDKKYKIIFYDNLEEFYKNLYEKVREKANKEREILN